ncbi:hypothetical protein QYF36_023518 [Acer negundo]|nr:hypothetical protein QYF36_023518 [Acer negundo]
MLKPQILLVTYPGQGHINPGLQLAKRLVSIGVQVTFVTSVCAIRRMNKTSIPEGLTFGSFSDGYDDGFKHGDGDDIYWAELRRVGSQTLTEFVVASTEQGKHYSCIVYSILLPWIEKVAAAANIPTTLFWNQTATMLDVYYYYSNGYGDVIKNNINDPSFSLKLQGLPELNSRDFPSFFVSSNPYPLHLPLFLDQIEILDQQSHPRVLVNTFDALESEALKAINHKYNVVGIGPLIPSAFLDGKDPSDKCFGGDIVNSSSSSSSKDSYMEWLDSNPESSNDRSQNIPCMMYASFTAQEIGSKEMASNAKKWMELARDAAKEAGGSSHKNLKEFVDEISHV